MLVGVLIVSGVLAVGVLWLAVMGSGDNRDARRYLDDTDWDD